MMMKIVGAILENLDLLDIVQLVKTAANMRWMENIVYFSTMDSSFQ